ncbi:hypothetical protein EMCRGX_G005280 [Ephydatia muelleri]
MDREPQPAETLYDAEDGLLGGAPPDAPRDGEALPNDAATLPQPPEPGGALPDLTETSTPPAETGTTARCIPGQRAVNYTITHPNQTRFECPVCKLTYTSHHSLVRHVGVSHSRLVLTISYKCALCDYAHPSLRSTSSHYRLSHGAAWARRRSRREQGAEQEQELGRPNNRASGYARRAARAKVLQRLYQANPGACMRRLLDNTPPVYCNIGEQELVAHYAAALAEPPPLGPPPTWLFPNRHPEDSGETAVTDKGDVLQPPVTPDEVVCQLRRAKWTAPGADGITYAGWKWIDPQGLILATIYNTCRTNARIPREWKHSTVTLIHKGGDVTSIRNWRPICLQLTLYKLYSAIIARRIASWAMEANAFSPAQKGFLAYDGCAEHNFLLRSVMVEARRNKRNLLLAWLDLKDAFGSVPHDLILLSMKRLGLSGSAIDIINNIYYQSTIAIRTGRDTYTAAIKQNRGVKQGCPLSPILFNIALEGLLKLLATNTAGFPVAGYTINSLAYADDVCVIATSKSELQGLLDQCHAFTTWAGLVFNAKKCGSLCMTNEAPRLYVDHLYSPHLGAEAIPALTWDERYKYLGCPAGATRTPVDTLQDLRDNLLHDTGIVFASELAEWQKLDAFHRFLFPRVTFALKVVFPGTKWSQKLDTALRITIKRKLRLPSRVCTKYLYLPQALGGIGIPSIVDESHVTRAAQAFKFLADTRDPCLRDIAVHQLTDTVAKRAHYLDPTKHEHLTTFLNTSSPPGEGRAGDLQSLWSSARASLTHTGAIIVLTQDSATIEISQHILTWDKRKDLYPRLREAIQARCLRDLKRTADQGRAFDSVSLHPDSTFFTYTGKFLSFYQYRFIHKARLNLLPVRSVQARCRKAVPSTQCHLCGRGEETLAHIINHCHHNLGMIRERHNAILERIVRAIPDHLGTKMKEQPIPGQLAPTDPTSQSSPQTNALEEAATAKLLKYEPLRQELLQRYSVVEVLPFIVGALGSWYPPNDRVLSKLHIGWRYAALMRRLCVVSAISGSQGIWYKSMCTQRRAPNQAEDTATRETTPTISSTETQESTITAPSQPEPPTTTRENAREPPGGAQATNVHT